MTDNFDPSLGVIGNTNRTDASDTLKAHSFTDSEPRWVLGIDRRSIRTTAEE